VIKINDVNNTSIKGDWIMLFIQTNKIIKDSFDDSKKRALLIYQ